MFCEKCGSDNGDGQSICYKCGNPIINQTNSNNVADSDADSVADSASSFIPKPVARQNVAKRSAVILAVAISVVATVLVVAVLYFALDIGANGNRLDIGANDDNLDIGVNGNRFEGSGYESAEDAVKAYLEAFINADVDAMTSTFAVETYVENFNLEASLERLRAYTLASQQSFPSNNQFTTDMNIQQRQSQIASFIRYQYMSLFIPKAINEGMMTTFADTQESRSFIRTLGDQSYINSLSEMSIIGFVSPSSLHDSYTSEANQRYINQTTEILGAQGVEDVVARVELDNQNLLFCFDAVRYGDKWYVHSLGGNIGTLLGISLYAMGVVPESD